MNLPDSFGFLWVGRNCKAEFDSRLCIYKIHYWNNEWQTELKTRYELEMLFERGECKMLNEKKELPDEFEFVHRHSGNKFKVTKCEYEEKYKVEWTQNGGGSLHYPARFVQSYIEDGSWQIVEPVKPIRTKQHISINVNSVFAAAKFEVENNIWSKDKSIQEVVDQIHDAIANLLDKAVESWEYSFTGTGCWKVEFVVEDELHAMIEVLVDPAIGQNMYYVSIEDYWSQN